MVKISSSKKTYSEKKILKKEQLQQYIYFFSVLPFHTQLCGNHVNTNLIVYTIYQRISWSVHRFFSVFVSPTIIYQLNFPLFSIFQSFINILYVCDIRMTLRLCRVVRVHHFYFFSRSREKKSTLLCILSLVLMHTVQQNEQWSTEEQSPVHHTPPTYVNYRSYWIEMV